MNSNSTNRKKFLNSNKFTTWLFEFRIISSLVFICLLEEVGGDEAGGDGAQGEGYLETPGLQVCIFFYFLKK